MTQTTIFAEPPLVENADFTAWFPAADPLEIAARLSDPDVLIDYLSKANDLTRSETIEMLDVLQLNNSLPDDTTALRAA